MTDAALTKRRDVVRARELLEEHGYRVLEQQTPDDALDRDWRSFLFALKAASDRAKNGAHIHLTDLGFDPVSTYRSAIHRMVDDVLSRAIVEKAVPYAAE